MTDYAEIVANLTDEEAVNLDLMAKHTLASEFNLRGFAYFFYFVFGEPLLKHQIEPLKTIFHAHSINKGALLEEFRGAAKTTTVTIHFIAWLVGLNPHLNGLLIQVGDDIAQDNAGAIATIIEHKEGWKSVFPHVVPDKEKGWGANGYHVMRDDLTYPEWLELKKDKDPTFVGLGYKSRSIIGKRPTNFMILDDIHDENNTGSDRELAKVKKIYTDTILPTLAPGCLEVIIGTPWNKRDIIAYAKSTGEFVHIAIPVYNGDEKIVYNCPAHKNTGIVPDSEACNICGEQVEIVDTTDYTWPDRFGRIEIRKARNKFGKIGFARMFLLDLEAAQNTIFSYFLYPNDRLNPNMRMVAGVDYAGTMDEAKNREGRNDYFAMAYVVVTEQGIPVVYDGVREHVTQGRGEKLVKRAQSIFPGFQHVVIEGDGKGEEFVQMIGLRNPDLRVVMMKTGGRGKGKRLEKQMGPWLESGRVRISDADTPFLNALKAELDDYPLNDNDDCMDAVYWALRGLSDVLQIPADAGELPPTENEWEQSYNPYEALF